MRTLLGFFLLCGGAYNTFLFNDPTDNAVTGQILPAAISTCTGVTLGGSAGSGYVTGDVVAPAGGVWGAPAQFSVTAAGGAITGLSPLSPGNYGVIPGTTNVGGSPAAVPSGVWLELRMA